MQECDRVTGLVSSFFVEPNDVCDDPESAACVAATAAFVWMELASHGSRHVELAVETMTHGRYARQFWVGGVLVGMVVPAALAILALATDTASPALLASAGIAAVAGLFAYEDAFVRAGQSVPLS